VLSQYNVALFHLVNHAFFKALLFLSAGQIIHSMLDQQDVRKLGGLINYLPLTYSIMIIGSLSLLATPFLTGFYSKDLIIELAFSQYSYIGTFSYYLLTITAGLTAFYSFRLIMLTFLTIPSASRGNYLSIQEANKFVIIPLLTLSIFSIFFGYIFSDLFTGIGTDTFELSLFIQPKHISLIEAEFSLPLIIKILPALLTILGIILSVILYQKLPELLVYLTNFSIGKKLYTFFNGKYFFDIIYNYYISNKGLQFGFYISNILEKGSIEILGPFGLSNVLSNTGKTISKLDTGIVTSYALYIVLGLISLMFVIFSPIYFDISLIFEFRVLILYFLSIILYISLI
jgi:NADH-ubiquinone oxidoreductase chain 5